MLKRMLAGVALLAFIGLGPNDTGLFVGVGLQAQAGGGKLKFEVYRDTAKDYRWRLRGADDKVLATAGQSFVARAACLKSVEGMQKNLDKRTFEVYEDKGKGYRWRLKASNGQVVATSGGAYETKEQCDKAIETVKKGAPKAEVVEEKAKE